MFLTWLSFSHTNLGNEIADYYLFVHHHTLLQQSPKEETSSGSAVSAPRNLWSLLLTKDTELFLEMRVTFLVLPIRNWFLVSSVLM